MKVWERRLMKDFHVAPVEMADPDVEEQEEARDKVDESPLERFRRISRQVASQSAGVKWMEVIRGATIEANSQIGRCKNRESFKNQQNLLKAMEQARKLIERGPMQSPNHSFNYDVMDQTNQTLVQLLKNISEEINDFSPNNTLKVVPSHNRSVTPLQSLNAQLQSLISRSPSPHPAFKSKMPSVSSKPAYSRTNSLEGTLNPTEKSLPSTSSPTPPKSRSETPKSPIPKASMMKTRSPTPDSRKSLDSVDSVRSIPVIVNAEQSSNKSDSPKLIDLRGEDQSPLKQSPGSPTKVFKRKAPIPMPISVSRPASLRISNEKGMIPPPPSKDETRPLQIPILSTTPATPLLLQKPMSSTLNSTADNLSQVSSEPLLPTLKAPEIPKNQPSFEETSSPASKNPPEVVHVCSEPEPPAPSMIAVTSPVSHNATEKLIVSQPQLKARSPSPACLRPGKKIEDVKTIQRQARTGWL